MKKRIIALLLLLTMVCALFAGCGKNEEAEAPKAETLANDTLPAGTYEVLDEDEVIAVLVSTGKKLTVYDADGEDGEELMEESKFSYDKDEEAFMIDDTKAFSLEVGKKETTITVPKKSPLGIDKGSYTLQVAEDEDEVPTLEKGTYAVLDEDDEMIAILECTGKKIAVYSPDDEELMEESKFSYDEDEEAFMIDDTAAFTLEVSKKTITITVPKKSPLGLDKGTYTLEKADAGSKPEPTDAPIAVDNDYCKLPEGYYEVMMDAETSGYMQVDGNYFIMIDEDGETETWEVTFNNDTKTYIDGSDELCVVKNGDGTYKMYETSDESFYLILIPCSESDLPGGQSGEFDLSKLNPNTVYEIATAGGRTLYARYPEVFLNDSAYYNLDDGSFYQTVSLSKWSDDYTLWYSADYDLNDYAYYGDTESDIMDTRDHYYDNYNCEILETESDTLLDTNGDTWYYRMDIIETDYSTEVDLLMLSADGTCKVYLECDIDAENAEDYISDIVDWMTDAIDVLYIE